MWKEDVPREEAIRQVREEVKRYKKTLEQGHIAYRIIEETDLPGGSVQIKIIKQYNQSPVGDYLNQE